MPKSEPRINIKYMSYSTVRVLFFLAIFMPISAHSASLAEQLGALEGQKKALDAQVKAAKVEIDAKIFKRYRDVAKVTVSNPTISSLNGNKARVLVVVGISLPIAELNSMQKVIEKNIDARVDEDGFQGPPIIKYSFNEWCYEGIGNCPAELKTKLSPVIWSELSDNALGIEINFMGIQKKGILIGQVAGGIGEISASRSFKFEFEVPKASIRNNQNPKINFVKYKCQWNFKSPIYRKVRVL